MTDFIERPATKSSMLLRSTVCGFGINDSSYITSMQISGKTVHCPFYRAWHDMVNRCYSSKVKDRQPAYIGCSVINEWLIFSNFKKWMIKQDWKGKQLDKDIIIPGNKVYGPNACIFVSGGINKLLTNNASRRGGLQLGVCAHKDKGKFRAQCRVDSKTKHIGIFSTSLDAEAAYLEFKSDLIRKIAGEEEANNNQRLKSALLRHADTFKSKASSLVGAD